MSSKRIFQVAGLLAFMLLFCVGAVMAQTEPPLTPDAGVGELTAYFNYLLAGITSVATLIVGYIAKYIPGINMIGDKFLRILVVMMVVGLFLFLALSSGRNWFDVIGVLIGFLSSTGLIYPGLLKPAGLKST
jgi:Mn2+/Fe2+ NRAMP family transporter